MDRRCGLASALWECFVYSFYAGSCPIDEGVPGKDQWTCLLSSLSGHDGLVVGAGGSMTLALLVCLSGRPLFRCINGPRPLPEYCPDIVSSAAIAYR